MSPGNWLLLSAWVVAMHAEFDEYVDETVMMPSVTLMQDCITS